MMRRTKIIATLGPASETKEELAAILKNGANIIRLNGAHGSIELHKKRIDLIKRTSKSLNLRASILFDLPGPKLRIGELKNEKVFLKTGRTITLICGETIQRDARIPVPFALICRAVKKGDKIFINDGLVETVVKKVRGKNIDCLVVSGGEIKSRKGINLPGTKLSIPSLTKRDKELLKFAIKNGVDYVGLSFVRSAKNIAELRKLMRKAPHIGVVAKIEKPEALADLDEIISLSDAVMVARGDLGIEMSFNRIPLIQRTILKRCLMAGKPSIVATQMLESMVSSPLPTRAEATDVAGAVWEGADAVMLSEETSVGANPARAVAAMAKIASEAEKEMPHIDLPCQRHDGNERQAQMVSLSASILADRLHAKVIVTPTRSGRTALYMSRMRPKANVIAIADDERIVRKVNLFRGVIPMLMPKFSTVDQTLAHAERVALHSGLIKKGDTIVITSGAHGRKDDITKLIEVRQVGKNSR